MSLCFVNTTLPLGKCPRFFHDVGSRSVPKSAGIAECLFFWHIPIYLSQLSFHNWKPQNCGGEVPWKCMHDAWIKRSFKSGVVFSFYGWFGHKETACFFQASTSWFSFVEVCGYGSKSPPNLNGYACIHHSMAKFGGKIWSIEIHGIHGRSRKTAVDTTGTGYPSWRHLADAPTLDEGQNLRSQTHRNTSRSRESPWLLFLPWALFYTFLVLPKNITTWYCSSLTHNNIYIYIHIHCVYIYICVFII